MMRQRSVGPQMRFVTRKTVEQQDLQALHRVRSRLIGTRTQIGNQIRGLLAEYGIVLSQHLSSVRKMFPPLTEENETRLSGFAKRLFTTLYEELCALDQRMLVIEAELIQAFQQNALCQRIAEVEGVGPVTAKRGDYYLRTLLVHGSRSIVFRASKKEDARSKRIAEKQKKLGTAKACVAVANKNARIIWALLAHDAPYRRAA